MYAIEDLLGLVKEANQRCPKDYRFDSYELRFKTPEDSLDFYNTVQKILDFEEVDDGIQDVYRRNCFSTKLIFSARYIVNLQKLLGYELSLLPSKELKSCIAGLNKSKGPHALDHGIHLRRQWGTLASPFVDDSSLESILSLCRSTFGSGLAIGRSAADATNASSEQSASDEAFRWNEL